MSLREQYKAEHLRKAKETWLPGEVGLPAVLLVYGYQTYGPGMFSAGWITLEGAVFAEPVEGTSIDDGFVYQVQYLVRPVTREALLLVWHYEGGVGGVKKLGRNGYVYLRSGGIQNAGTL